MVLSTLHIPATDSNPINYITTGTNYPHEDTSSLYSSSFQTGKVRTLKIAKCETASVEPILENWPLSFSSHVRILDALLQHHVAFSGVRQCNTLLGNLIPNVLLDHNPSLPQFFCSRPFKHLPARSNKIFGLQCKTFSRDILNLQKRRTYENFH